MTVRHMWSYLRRRDGSNSVESSLVQPVGEALNNWPTLSSIGRRVGATGCDGSGLPCLFLELSGFSAGQT